MRNNAKKTKDLIFCFAHNQSTCYPIFINGTQFQQVTCRHKNSLDNLKWNVHIDQIIKKANTKLFFVRLLKNACRDRASL